MFFVILEKTLCKIIKSSVILFGKMQKYTQNSLEKWGKSIIIALEKCKSNAKKKNINNY